MKTRLRTIAILSLLGTPSYILCYFWHICMAGHMQHPPYSLYHWINDCWWAVCFIAVSVFSVRLQAKRKRIFFYGSILLVLSRIFMGSSGGGNIILELPLLITIDIFALLYIFKPEKFTISEKKKELEV